MLNAYESIDDACNQYSAGSISDTDLRNNLEQVSTSKGMSIIIVNSDWTTFYVSTHGDEMMLERLKRAFSIMIYSKGCRISRVQCRSSQMKTGTVT